MNEILGMNISEMAGKSFECSCGRKHSVDIKNIIIGNGLVGKIKEIASAFMQGQIFLMADSFTFAAYGREIEKSLLHNGFNLKTYVFETKHPLVPDEKALGKLLTEIEADTTLIISVGSGTLNDLGKYLSCKLKIPYIIACTAPSMDGYASTVSPLIIEGFKKTFEAVYPYAVIADLDILTAAPENMLKAGYGDIIGKMTALADWELSKKINNEYYCETCVKLVKDALGKCIENARYVETHDEKAVRSIIEALVLSGVAMGLSGNSRPASGAEHHLAHFWEMDALARGVEHPLHGNSVGAATVVIASVYELLKQKLPVDINVPEPSEVSRILQQAGACDSPSLLGISRELFRRSVLGAIKIRPRYTVFHEAVKMGMLEEIADMLTERFYCR